MGNVLAAAPIRQPPAPSSPEEPGKSNSDDTPSSPLGPPESTPLFPGNPGSMEDLHKKCKDLFPMPFEGGRFIINKPLSNHFQISHTLNMSSVTPPGYRFGATYVGTKQIGVGEAYPVLLGDIDPSGNLNSHIIYAFNERIKSKFVAQFQDSRMGQMQTSTDFKGDNFTAAATFVNPDILNRAGICVLHYLQSVTPTIDVGAELVHHRGPAVPNGAMNQFSMSARYKSPLDFIISGTMSMSRLNLCYYHKGIDDVAQFGCELETDLKQGESVATFGYQIELPKANVTFKASVDTNLTAQAVMEKRLMPLPFTFILSGHVLHAKIDSYKFGVGLMIG